MELEKVLHMKGGSGEASYAQTAYIARTMISMTKSRREEAITELINDLELSRTENTTLYIADLGCASGPNTLRVVSDLVITSERIRQKMDHPDPMEYQIYLNDLPGNDFNSVFQSLEKFHQGVKEQTGLEGGQVFVGAMPGSFYGRLFPTQSLHFVHSSYSLYWLSQVPKGIKDNKRNIYMSSTSPKSVVKAYREQFHMDTQLFLRSRSMELIKGGKMVLTYWGRSSEDPTNIESCFIWDFLAHVLNKLVSQGIVEEEKLEAFNVPIYLASSTELIEEVKKEGSFYINVVDVSQVNINGQEIGTNFSNKLLYTIENDKKCDLSKLLRTISESILVNHFGEAIIDEVFRRFSSIIEDATSNDNLLVTNVTMLLTKK